MMQNLKTSLASKVGTTTPATTKLTVPKLTIPKLDEHDQGVVRIMALLPTDTFSDGVESSAFKLNPQLLGSFIGEELSSFISGLSNGFDFVI